MPEIETVEINGVIVNKGEEEKAAKWAKDAPDEESVEETEDEPKRRGRPKNSE